MREPQLILFGKSEKWSEYHDFAFFPNIFLIISNLKSHNKNDIQTIKISIPEFLKIQDKGKLLMKSMFVNLLCLFQKFDCFKLTNFTLIMSPSNLNLHYYLNQVSYNKVFYRCSNRAKCFRFRKLGSVELFVVNMSSLLFLFILFGTYISLTSVKKLRDPNL